MVNVVNLGQRPITITHVWFAFDPPVHVINPNRPLPKTLEPDEPWETWSSLSRVDREFARADMVPMHRAPRVGPTGAFVGRPRATTLGGAFRDAHIRWKSGSGVR